MITTHRHKGAANKAKAAALLDLFDPYADALRALESVTLVELRAGQRLRSWRVMKPEDLGFQTVLTSRMLKSVHNKLYEALSGWLVRVQDQVRTYITNSSLPAPRKTVLYRINAATAWWETELVLAWQLTSEGELIPATAKQAAAAEPGTVVWLPVEAADTALARALAKQAIKTAAGIPRFDKLDTINLDRIVAEARPADKPGRFSWWIDSATLVRGRRVAVPLVDNPYYARELAKNGEVAGMLQLHRVRNPHGAPVGVDASIVIRRPDAQPREQGQDLGADFGMRNALFATSDGRLLGRKILHTLSEWDQRLTSIAAQAQREGRKLKDCPEYVALNQRIKGFVTNEIGRILNQLARTEGEAAIRTLVVEKLDFRHGGMSRRMNRLISRTGRAVVKQRLAALTAKHGIEVVEVGSAYTSQECSACGYTAKNNRNRDRFHCRFCGLKLHADINAAKVIVGRRSLHTEDHTRKSARNTTLAALDSAWRQRWKLPTQGADPFSYRLTGQPDPQTA